MKHTSPIILLLVLIAGCGKPTAEPPVDQFSEGERLYTTYCASCHEIENGIGPRLTQQVIASRVNAQLLYNYNKRNMPYQAGNTLTEDQYWSITAYLLIREGFLSEDERLSPENAAGVSLTD